MASKSSSGPTIKTGAVSCGKRSFKAMTPASPVALTSTTMASVGSVWLGSGTSGVVFTYAP